MRLLTFQVLEGVDKGRVYRDLPIPVTIGREEGNRLRLNDERISRFHCKVQCDKEDVILTDLDSTNGTRVNGSPVQIRRLRPGDQIWMGRSVLLFGSWEEINARKTELVKAAGSAGGPERTVAGVSPSDVQDFDLDVAVSDVPPQWVASDKQLPPLPRSLSAGQAARLTEMLDYLHRGLVSATENISSRDHDGTQIVVPFADWQKIQAVQLFLARYVRAVTEPDPLSD